MDTVGLLLIRKLIQLHKGKLSFHRKEGGKVATIITFPVAIRQLHKTTEVSIMSDSPEFPSIDIDYALSEDNASKKKLRARTPSDSIKQKHSLLLVEENEELCAYLADVLSADYTVIATADSREALKITQKKRPDLVLSNASGKELCLQIKFDEDTSHIPVILFMEPMDEIPESHRVADRYISMPLNISLLKVEIDNLIVNRKIIHKRYMKLAFGFENEVDTEDGHDLSESEQKFITNLRKLVEERMSDSGSNFNIDSLCEAMSMSRTSFYLKIKEITHQMPIEYVRNVRLGCALRLLKETKLSVTEVAELAGFNDVKYFSGLFKKNFGDSPTKYVKKQ